jgi:hypothetical protein
MFFRLAGGWPFKRAAFAEYIATEKFSQARYNQKRQLKPWTY